MSTPECVLVLSLACFISLFSVGFCAIYRKPAYIHPDFPGQCYFNDTHQAYNPGDYVTLPGCTRLRCYMSVDVPGRPSILNVEVASCGVYNAEPGCFLTRNMELPYPECCAQLVCLEDVENNESQRDDLLKETEDEIIKNSIHNWLLQDLKLSKFS